MRASRGSPEGQSRVLIIPGLNGHPGLLMRYAPTLFPDWTTLAFNHHLDLAIDGVEGLAERALALLGEDQTPAFVCGESFGGTIALTLARQAPERVKGLILFSAFGWHPSALARRGVGALRVWSFLAAHVSMPLYQGGRALSLPGQVGSLPPRSLLGNYFARPRAHVAAYRRKAELSLTFDARPWLPSIACPTFILVGTRDPVVPASAGRELARVIPSATLHRLPGGHLVHLVHVQRVARDIQDWAHGVH
ncbi:MAG: alpha/beta fold hydrolase [Chloroflexi bacterium]|nr:alpha/beta fold hydrolase [Chloroflexota bacterium]